MPTKLIYVVAANQGGDADVERGLAANAPCVLWERHPDHPDGEVWVAGPGVVRVAPTAEVTARLQDGRLIRTNKDGKPLVSNANDGAPANVPPPPVDVPPPPDTPPGPDTPPIQP